MAKLLILINKPSSFFNLSEEADVTKVDPSIFWAYPERKKPLIEKLVVDGYCINFENEFISLDKTHKTVLMSSSIMSYRGQNVIFSIYNDITEQKRLEIEKNKSDERFKLSMEATNDGLWDWNVESNDTYYNPSYFKMLGYTQDEFKQNISTWLDLLHPDDKEKALKSNIDCIEGHANQFETEFRLKTKEGNWKWILGRGKCIERNKDGKALRLIGTHVDINERKEIEEELKKYKDNLELLVQKRTEELQQEITLRQKTEHQFLESETKYRNLVDYSSSIVLEWDTEGKILYLNQFGLDFFGFSPEEIIGKNVLGTIVESIDSDGYDLESKMKTVQKNPKDFYSSENENVMRNKEKVWIAWTNKGIYDTEGNLIKTLSVGIDRTGQHQMEMELSKYREHLQDLVAKRTEELTISNQQLIIAKELAETASKAKSEFLSNMSHEIRTPLNGIFGFLDILYECEEDKEKKECFEIIKKSSSQLLSIVNDILSLSKIEAGKYFAKASNVDLFELTNKIAKVYSKNLQAKNIEFIFHFDLTMKRIIKIDEKSFVQIVNNLFSNSCKFTLEGSVEFSIKEFSKNKLEIRIKDTGIGISEEKQKKLFEPFDQGEYYLTKQFGGAGLGLSIVKRLIDLLNGEIKLKTEIGKGTEIKIILPFEPVEKENEIFISSEDNIDYPLSIKLISAEDDEINQLLIARMLQEQNWTFEQVSNGLELLEELEKNDYDLILMEIQMPVLNGIEATKIIRNQEKHKDLPIIAVSAFASEENIDEMKKAGIDDYISKPIKKEELIKKIKNWGKIVKNIA